MVESAYLAVGSNASPYSRIYNTVDWSARIEPVIATSGTVNLLMFSPDNKWLAIGGLFSDRLRVVNLTTWGEETIPQLPSSTVYSLVFTHDGKYLIVGEFGTPSIHLYDVDAGWIRIAQMNPGVKGYGLAVSPDDSILVFSGNSAINLAYDISDPSNPSDIISPYDVTMPANAYSLEFSPDGAYISATVPGDVIYLYDVVGQSFTLNKSTSPTGGDTWRSHLLQSGNFIANTYTSGTRGGSATFPGLVMDDAPNPAVGGTLAVITNRTDGSESSLVAYGSSFDYVRVYGYPGLLQVGSDFATDMGDIRTLAFDYVVSAPPVVVQNHLPLGRPF